MAFFRPLALAAAAALVLAACGGGSSDTSTKVKITSVIVVGDSLSDSGVFEDIPTRGRIFSVQGTGHQIWTERIAAVFGVAQPCAFFKFTGTTFVANSTPGCTSFAVGGGQVNNPNSTGGSGSPFSIPYQLGTRLAVSGGAYSATDLLLVDGGGNDAAELAGAYLKAGGDGGVAFATLIGSVGIAPPASAAEIPAKGAAYMTALANALFDSVKAQALDKGAKRAVIVNTPAINLTPRFQMVLDGVAAAYGGGAAGATARAQTDALIDSWVAAFNTQLASRVAGNSAVVLVDLNTEMKLQIAQPAQFGLTNVKDTACPAVTDGSGNLVLDGGLPTYNFETCTADALSAMTPPAGATGGANWWKTYAFSDGFHPTPYGYQLLAQLVSKQLVLAGWL